MLLKTIFLVSLCSLLIFAKRGKNHGSDIVRQIRESSNTQYSHFPESLRRFPGSSRRRMRHDEWENHSRNRFDGYTKRSNLERSRPILDHTNQYQNPSLALSKSYKIRTSKGLDGLKIVIVSDPNVLDQRRTTARENQRAKLVDWNVLHETQSKYFRASKNTISCYVIPKSKTIS